MSIYQCISLQDRSAKYQLKEKPNMSQKQLKNSQRMGYQQIKINQIHKQKQIKKRLKAKS